MAKRLIRPAAILSISLLIALTVAGIPFTAGTAGSDFSTTAAYFLQATPTPRIEKDRSVIGSTDGIVVMGGIIVLIVLIPLIVQRRSWQQTE